MGWVDDGTSADWHRNPYATWPDHPARLAVAIHRQEEAFPYQGLRTGRSPRALHLLPARPGDGLAHLSDGEATAEVRRSRAWRGGARRLHAGLCLHQRHGQQRQRPDLSLRARAVALCEPPPGRAALLEGGPDQRRARRPGRADEVERAGGCWRSSGRPGRYFCCERAGMDSPAI